MMFRCTYCGKLSKKGEMPIPILHAARMREYRNNDRQGNFTLSYGWEIVKQGNAAPSHGHVFKKDTVTKHLVPVVGFNMIPLEKAS
jgi:hypothetical protein